MNARDATADAIRTHRDSMKGLSDEQLLAITWQDAANPPRALAAKQELDARRESKEDEKHQATIMVAVRANRLSQRALLIALFALLVSVLAWLLPKSP